MFIELTLRLVMFTFIYLKKLKTVIEKKQKLNL
jgi:hypothetical protein